VENSPAGLSDCLGRKKQPENGGGRENGGVQNAQTASLTQRRACF